MPEMIKKYTWGQDWNSMDNKPETKNVHKSQHQRQDNGKLNNGEYILGASLIWFNEFR